jgi:1,4-dihydroxy-2-naphthoyl-CoA hydrolase
MIWKQQFTPGGLNKLVHSTLAEHLGIEFTESGDDFLKATMPVDKRTVQPMGLLHGGASTALSETIGSVASVMCLEDFPKHSSVGVEINANHLRQVTSGHVTATARPVRLGRKIHVWNIEINDESGNLVCVSRLTCMIVSTGRDE